MYGWYGVCCMAPWPYCCIALHMSTCKILCTSLHYLPTNPYITYRLILMLLTNESLSYLPTNPYVTYQQILMLLTDESLCYLPTNPYITYRLSSITNPLLTAMSRATCRIFRKSSCGKYEPTTTTKSKRFHLYWKYLFFFVP